MKINKKDIKKILFISLSNIGDIILTTPVFMKLHETYPKAGIDVVTGMVGREIFAPHSAVRNVFVPERPRSFKKRLKELAIFRKNKYDMVVDMKNSLIPYLVGAKYYSNIELNIGKLLFKKTMHKKEEHLNKIKNITENPFRENKFFIPITISEKEYIDKEISKIKKIVTINPGAKNHMKRWAVSKYAHLADKLVSELNAKIIFTGSKEDSETINSVILKMKREYINLCAKTSLGALSELIKRSDLIITNDSAPLHIASAVNSPTIAIFGPTDEKKYGPLSKINAVLKSDKKCRPCNKSGCRKGFPDGCISDVKVEDVFNIAKRILKEE